MHRSAATAEGVAAAAFDARTHLVLSDELKQLYVACTRARERLVFFDQSATARKAFFDALLHRRIGRAHNAVLKSNCRGVSFMTFRTTH